jgi:predicted amidohydrolase
MERAATVAACQLDVSDLDVAANLAAVERRVSALAADVDVALFPEHALTGFVADDRLGDAAIPRDSDAVDRLREAAADADCALLVGFVEAADDLYNAAAYVRPDGEVVVYRKRNLWAGEHDVLSPGEDRVVVETPAGRTGLLTCYDLNHVAESAAMAERGVDALFVVGAWPAAHSENWRLLCRARALDGVRFLVAAGRTGRRELADARPTQYAGRSLAVRPDGSVMAALNRDERDLVATLEPRTLARQRRAIPVLEEPPAGTDTER